MDILIRLRDLFISLIYGLPESITSFILRIGLMLALSFICLVSSWLFLSSRSIFTQAAIAFVSFTLCLYIPVERVREIGEGVLAFAVILSFLAMVFLPSWLPGFLAPRYGDQLRLKKILRWTVWVLFVLQIIVR